MATSKKSKSKSKVAKPAAKAKPKAKPVAKAMKKATAKSAAKPAAKSAAKVKGVAKGKGRVAAKPTKAAKAVAPVAAAKAGKVEKAAKTQAANEIFTPLDDRVVIEPVGAAEKTAGGLYIPEMVQERPREGKVVAVGKGHRSKKGVLRPLDVKMGDSVLYAQYAGVNVQLGGREMVLLREEEILAVVKS